MNSDTFWGDSSIFPTPWGWHAQWRIHMFVAIKKLLSYPHVTFLLLNLWFDFVNDSYLKLWGTSNYSDFNTIIIWAWNISQSSFAIVQLPAQCFQRLIVRADFTTIWDDGSHGAPAHDILTISKHVWTICEFDDMSWILWMWLYLNKLCDEFRPGSWACFIRTKKVLVELMSYYRNIGDIILHFHR